MNCNLCRYAAGGFCRRWPPVATAMGALWPSVQAWDWCGEFSPQAVTAQVIQLETAAAPKRRGRPPKVATDA
jgi:hypothetical protein